jgi:hypothetical protein
MSETRETAKPTVRLSLESVDALVQAEIQHHPPLVVPDEMHAIKMHAIELPLESLHARLANLFVILAKQVTRGSSLQMGLLRSAHEHITAAKEIRELPPEEDAEGEGA